MSAARKTHARPHATVTHSASFLFWVALHPARLRRVFVLPNSGADEYGYTTSQR